jgi:hypothetical protein
LKAGLFESNITASPIIENLFSSIVIVAVVTTLLAPIGFRMLLARQT